MRNCTLCANYPAYSDLKTSLGVCSLSMLPFSCGDNRSCSHFTHVPSQDVKSKCRHCEHFKAGRNFANIGICGLTEHEVEVDGDSSCPAFKIHHLVTSESDPTGRKPSDAGAKLDAGKPRCGLVLSGFSRALLAVSEVGTYGAKKYSDNGWMRVPDGENRYTDALYRHLLKQAGGEEKDADTDLLHAAHAAWNALARLELMLREKETNTNHKGAT